MALEISDLTQAKIAYFVQDYEPYFEQLPSPVAKAAALSYVVASESDLKKRRMNVPYVWMIYHSMYQNLHVLCVVEKVYTITVRNNCCELNLITYEIIVHYVEQKSQTHETIF